MAEEMDIETRRFRNRMPKQTGISTGPMTTTPSTNIPPPYTAEEEDKMANDVAQAIIDGLKDPTITGGQGNSKRANAQQYINSLRARMAGPSQYAGLNDQLSTIYADAEKRIREAGSGLGTYLSTPTGYTPQMSQAMATPSAAMSNYLNAIGASGQDVSAQRALTDAALQQIAASSAGFSGALTQSSQDIRNALAGAVPANVSAGLTQAALNRAALEAALAQATFRDRQSTEDQILQLALQYGIRI